MNNKSIVLIVFQRIFAVLVAIFTLAPVLLLFITSISYKIDMLSVPLKIIPRRITFERYVSIFTNNGSNDIGYTFRISMQNSLIISISVTIIAVIIGTLASYAFARLRFRFRDTLLVLMLFTFMIPPIVFVIPMYVILQKLGMLNSKTTLVILYLSFILPFIIWVMQGFFSSVSKTYEEAATIDGCTRMQILWKIFLPLIRPGLIATGILAFLMAWDEFFLALIFTSNLDAKTVAIAISEFNGKHSVDYGMISTGGIIAALPTVFIAAIFQKYIVMGMTAGGIKE